MMNRMATCGRRGCTPRSRKRPRRTPLDQEMKTLDGKKVNLAKKYKGKVVLLVNVASKCGYTPQYEELQALHEKYAKKGLAIVGVPCNQFGEQEPGTAEEIAEFCKSEVRRRVRHAGQGGRERREGRAALQVSDVQGERTRSSPATSSGTSKSSCSTARAMSWPASSRR